jgi:Uma2 family endonuclease
MAETRAKRWTVADVQALPYDEWTRYEIIDGELFVSTAPGDRHQGACTRCTVALSVWNDRTGLGVVLAGPGLVFSKHDAVIPDVIWASRARLATIERADRLHGAPELAVEVLSPGAANVRRDREIKLQLYSNWGVNEYWIVDWRTQTVEIYRRRDGQLELVATLGAKDELTSPLLPGFGLVIGRLFDWP